jgi:type II secretory pathway component GspD/PulD (secretin)
MDAIENMSQQLAEISAQQTTIIERLTKVEIMLETNQKADDDRKRQIAELYGLVREYRQEIIPKADINAFFERLRILESKPALEALNDKKETQGQILKIVWTVIGTLAVGYSLFILSKVGIKVP